MKTKIVGICNVTPDSFFDGGEYLAPKKAVEHVRRMLDEGADLVDIGAESTRPGAKPINEFTEWLRLRPVIETLGELGLLSNVSVDTSKLGIAERSLMMGVAMINNVEGDFLPIARIMAHRIKSDACLADARYTTMHIHKPTTHLAHDEPFGGEYSQVIEAMIEMWRKLMVETTIPTKAVVLDPGIGFGKSPVLSRQLLGIAQDLPRIAVMIGYSNKRFLGKVGLTNSDAGRISMESGAAYLRVHDVAGHVALRQEVLGV